jgi:hypothetical protein
MFPREHQILPDAFGFMLRASGPKGASGAVSAIASHPFGYAPADSRKRTQGWGTIGTMLAEVVNGKLGLCRWPLQSLGEVFAPVFREGGGVHHFLQQGVIVFLSDKETVHLGDGDAVGVTA